MSSPKRTTLFFESDEGVEIEEALKHMVTDDSFNTDASYSANSDLYPDHKMPFVEKHKNYLIKHPSADPRQYLANLRLITRKRVNVASY